MSTGAPGRSNRFWVGDKRTVDAEPSTVEIEEVAMELINNTSRRIVSGIAGLALAVTVVQVARGRQRRRDAGR